MRIFLGLALALVTFTSMGCATENVLSTDSGVDAAITADGGVDAGPRLDVGTDAGPADAATVDAAPPETCPTVGETDTVPCGMCGTVDRFCTMAHEWAYGTCTGETGVCVPGTTDSQSCGRCGTQTTFCSSTCAWVPMGACTGETGACTPGTSTRVSTGCPAGQTRLETCDATCTPTDGPCEAVECTPEDFGTVSCGTMCGTAQRVCDATGHWQLVGSCRNEGVCVEGTTQTNSCGVCGTRTETCDSTCHWVPSGVCTGTAVCTPPPTPTCSDAMHLRTYDPTPMCVSGACAYGMTDVLCPGGCTGASCVGSSVLIEGLGGPNGYGPGLLTNSDDGSSSPIALTAAWGAGLHYYDGTYASFFVNNNGNVSFGGMVGAYSPMFPGAEAPMIAPFWGDVDTRGSAPMHGDVDWYVDDARVVVTWHLVGYYAMHHDLENSFQLILTNRSDVAPGDFDVELRYAQCAWTTGDASGGMGGLGGQEANAGFDAGDRTRSLALPGSGTAAVLDLCTTSNVSSAGVWRYTVRAGLPS